MIFETKSCINACQLCKRWEFFENAKNYLGLGVLGLDSLERFFALLALLPGVRFREASLDLAPLFNRKFVCKLDGKLCTQENEFHERKRKLHKM